MASATRYGTAGHQKRGRPYLEVSGSLPHMIDPIASAVPER
jgi:hypothetical protein